MRTLSEFVVLRSLALLEENRLEDMTAIHELATAVAARIVRLHGGRGLAYALCAAETSFAGRVGAGLETRTTTYFRALGKATFEAVGGAPRPKPMGNEGSKAA